MNANHRNTARRTLASARRASWLAAGAFLICCGGRAATVDTSAVSGAGGDDPSAGGSSASAAGGTVALASGGEPSDGGNIIIVGVGGATLANGCPIPEAGAAGAEEEPCDGDTLLIQAIVDSATGGLGACDISSSPDLGEEVGPASGAVILDDTGRVIDNTRLSGANGQRFFDQLCNRRWPCLAGQTLYYKCSAD